MSIMSYHQDKSLDIRTRLELWQEGKRKQTKKEDKLRWNPSTRVGKNDQRNSTPYCPTPLSKLKKHKTQGKETKGFQSESKKSMDPNLSMRTRLDSWLKEKGKTPQHERIASRLTTPGVTPTQRRKTFGGEIIRNKSASTGKKQLRASYHRGILKHGTLRNKTSRKSCTLQQHGKENRSNKQNISPVTRTPPSVQRIVQEDGLHQKLKKCFSMIEMGAQDEVVFALDDIQHDNPNVLRHALYWICRAKLSEIAGDHDRVVCMFEQAFSFSAQPEQEIKNAYNKYITNKQQRDEQNTMFRTPRKTPSRELSRLDGEVFTSSVVRFCLMDSTPYKKRKTSLSEKRVITPVRRTTRWERCGINHPQIIEEKNMTVASLDELSNQLKINLVFKPNSLLPCDLDKELSTFQEVAGF